MEDMDPTYENVDNADEGPRIKHVSRRSTVALGLPRATFADAPVSRLFINLSALPQDEKEKIVGKMPLRRNVIEAGFPVRDSKPSASVAKKVVKSRKVYKGKNRVYFNLLKKSLCFIRKGREKRKLLVQKSRKVRSSLQFSCSPASPDSSTSSSSSSSNSDGSSSSSNTGSTGSSSSNDNSSLQQPTGTLENESAHFLQSAVIDSTNPEGSEGVNNIAATNSVFQLKAGLQELVGDHSQPNLIYKDRGNLSEPMPYGDRG